jgi:hypothetical protein
VGSKRHISWEQIYIKELYLGDVYDNRFFLEVCGEEIQLSQNPINELPLSVRLPACCLH